MPKKKAKKQKPPTTNEAEKPRIFLVRVTMMVFSDGGNCFESNESVARAVREMIEDNGIFTDREELDIKMKNDTDADWDDPWPEE